MGMVMRSIKNLAGDCEKTHRWCNVNLTEDDANDMTYRFKGAERRGR